MVFRCDATMEIALGHLKRCLSLAEAFQEIRRESVFLCFDEPAAREVLNGLPFRAIWLPDPVNRGNDAKATATVLGNLGSDMVIVDSYEIDAEYFDYLHQAGLRIIYFEDEAKTDWVVDAIINGTLGAERLRYNAPLALMGPAYLVLGRDYWNGGEGPCRPEASTVEIMITMGGIDHYDLTSRTLVILDRLKGPLKIHVVIGLYYENIANIDAAVARCRHETVIHDKPPGLADLIRRCNAAVSAGGVTLYELARFGVPAIGIWLWENQRQNTECLGKAGVIFPLAYEDGPEFDKSLEAAIKVLLYDPYKREKMRLTGLATVDGQGAFRVADALVKFQ